MKKVIVGLAMVAMVLSFAASSARAEDAVYQNEDAGETHCKADEANFCPFAVKDRGHRIECLKARQSELSKECAKWVDRHHEVYKARNKACKDDQKKFCPKDGHDYGALVPCLKSNMDKLSGDCKATFTM
ncbi:MAG: hypothetical protein COV45_01370 [Deltaproteobacteria bacterium CG11_big_fil_rev_8_21_14_0_20_47_16]|nr:MAG: hypothetical protein COV45_01370 [Deltaproteobacteria bacterium CG11_big_fil_rev_8_21_14_0_20_47_16]